MSSNNFLQSANNNINNLFEFSNKDSHTQKNKKDSIKNKFDNISEFKISTNNDNNLITGDRFIPLKNNLDNNEQNFLLNSSPFNFYSSNSNKKVDSISSSEGKIEKNYVNFIIDNMLKVSSDKFIIKNNDIRKNKIFSFSKRIYNTVSKNKLNNNEGRKEDIDKNKIDSLNLLENYEKNKNDKELNKKNKMDFVDDIYNNISINNFYK